MKSLGAMTLKVASYVVAFTLGILATWSYNWMNETPLEAVSVQASSVGVELMYTDPLSTEGYTNEYNEYISQSVDKWYPLEVANVEYKLRSKVQWICESGLDPQAVSPVGAVGIAQTMRATYDEVASKHTLVGDIWDARSNIEVGTIYMASRLRYWYWERPWIERLWLAIASYNAGAENIRKAQVLTHGALLWNDIREALPEVTGEHAKETWGNVECNRRLYTKLVSGV